MTCTPFPLCITPEAPVDLRTASSIKDESLTVQRSLVAVSYTHLDVYKRQVTLHFNFLTFLPSLYFAVITAFPALIPLIFA